MNCLQHPIYELIKPFAHSYQIFPSIDALNRQIVTILDKRVRYYQFVDQSTFSASGSFDYEKMVREQGKIMTREKSWHDIFNAWTWMCFPKTKLSLNKIQCRDFCLNSCQKRTNRQNILAHFDEDGMIIWYSSHEILNIILKHEWKRLFFEQRKPFKRLWSAWAFGHGLLEKALQPYLGLTAKALLVKVDRYFLGLSQQDQVHYMDSFLANAIEHRIEFVQNYRLQPIPIYGLPNWYPDQNANFYQNQAYFRPKNQQAKSVIWFE